MLYVETVNTGKPGQVAYDRLAGNVPDYADIVIRPAIRGAVEQLITELNNSDILPRYHWAYVNAAVQLDIWELERLQENFCGVWDSEAHYAREMMYGSYDDVLDSYIDWDQMGKDLTEDYVCVYLSNGQVMFFNYDN